MGDNSCCNSRPLIKPQHDRKRRANKLETFLQAGFQLTRKCIETRHQDLLVPKAAMAKPTALVILEHWHRMELPRYCEQRERCLLAPLRNENMVSILMAALLRPTGRALLSTYDARATDPLLGAAFALDLWIEAWLQDTPLLPPCDRCNHPTGNWCDHCDDTTTPLCSHRDDNDHCKSCNA